MPVAANSVLAKWAINESSEIEARKEWAHPFLPPSGIQIIDIRRSAVETNVKEDIHTLFNPKKGPRKLPTLLLYDEKGLQLFEKITYLEEYYLTNDEIDVLKRSAAEIAEAIPSGSMVIELGSGNLRKVILLLNALEEAGKSIDYYALDLSKKELERTLAHVPDFQYVKCQGLHGTYDDGREWLRKPENMERQKCLMNLGSSIGNFERGEAAAFLRSLADVLSPTDTILLGLDACQDPAKVYHAYNDREGVTHRFILNGLTHANRLLGAKVFNEAEWRVVGEYVFDEEGGRHQAFYSPLREMTVLGTVVRPHERIQVEQSVKYSQKDAERLWSASGLQAVQRWTTRGDEYGLHLLTKANMPFSLAPSVYAKSALPSLEEWKALWDAWDVVSRGMLPSTELLEKPIRLRNACIFYLGHIPAFLDVQLTKRTGEALTEPAWYRSIFERGIDPDVDNPELCHDHSEIPAEWPPVEDVLQYQEKVRVRLEKMYLKYSHHSGQLDGISRSIGQAIWVGFEHELMHIETLLYMMLQSDKTLPPPIASRPNFEKLAEKALAERVENEWFTVPQQQVTLGMDEPEPENDADSAHPFGWDNEKPARQTTVHAFQAKGRPITNEEYARYMVAHSITKAPTAWSVSEADQTTDDLVGNSDISLPQDFLAGKHVRTVYGLVPLKYALDWPVFASYDELSRCAEWLGGRVPSFEEARSIYQYARSLKRRDAVRVLGRNVPAVNGYLLKNGVQETPPTTPPSEINEECRQLDLFDDLDGANVGFQHWHPIPVTSRGNKLAGQAEMGGVWEWTSTTLKKFDGFQPMVLYPGYTADFFDGKHNIVLGGSWATHPRIAGRKSFMNWYQRNYPFAWVGARLVRDLEI